MDDAILRVPRISISADSPFEHDTQQRAESIAYLTRLSTSPKGPKVIAVDGAWGSGKSVFLEMWEKKLLKDNVCIHFNAWERDFHNTPINALVVEFLMQIRALQENGILNNDGLDALYKKGKSFARTLIRNSSLSLISKATAGIVDKEQLEALLGDPITTYEEEIQALREFRGTMEQLTVKLHDSENVQLPIYFLIDELDRCRPNFAIELLETIKHVFNTEGFVFVIGVNRDQLERVIRGYYGSDFDAHGYLHRFFDLVYELPSLRDENFYDNIFIRTDLSRYFMGKDFSDNFLRKFTSNLELSIRDIEQICCSVHQMQTMYSNLDVFGPVLLGLLAIKKKNPQAYATLEENKVKPDDYLRFLINEMGISEALLNHTPEGMFFKYGIRYGRNEVALEQELRSFRSSLDISAMSEGQKMKLEMLEAVKPIAGKLTRVFQLIAYHFPFLNYDLTEKGPLR